nr:DUF3182 family protein [Novosphingobium sp. KA1]
MNAQRSRNPLDNKHDRASRNEVTRRLARLCGGVPSGRHDRFTRFDTSGRSSSYFVPRDTLVTQEASALGITGENDLFGGVVPFRFVATKAVGHSLVAAPRAMPSGWNRDLGGLLDGSVLQGFSTFDRDDAFAAAATLLSQGPVRIKQVEATAGRGQAVIRSMQELETELEAIDPEQIRTDGLVIEENLEAVRTYSVGSTKLCGMEIAYWGIQAITTDRDGQTVYGGTRLQAVRGGLAELAARPLARDVAEAVEKARRYDRLIFDTFPGMYASRRNYDVASGQTPLGERRIGVLEQSWRVGGATPAEIAAFERFNAHPSCMDTICATVEIHGDADAAPPGASVYYAGIDPIAGPMTKYAMVIE